MKLWLVEGSGFVYGAMNFVDLTAVASTVMILQYNAPEIPENSTNKFEFFRWVIPICGGGTVLFGLLMIFMLWPMEIGQR